MSAVRRPGRTSARAAATPVPGSAVPGSAVPGSAVPGSGVPAPAGPVRDRPPSLTALLYEAVARLDAHFAAHAAAVGLTPSQANAIHALAGPLPMRELGRRMCCEPPNVTFVVDRLEERGLVVRTPDPADRRAKQIAPTAEGERLRADLIARLAQDPPLTGVTGPDRRTLRTLLASALGEDDWISTPYRV